MSPIAADVVLLPDNEMMDRAIEIHRTLIAEGRPEIALNHRDCLPHISLAMGCPQQRDIATIGNLLERLADQTSIEQLRITGLLTPADPQGTATSLLEVERTEELQRLHENVMTEMEPFFRADVTEAMIHDAIVTPSTLEWIGNYRRKSSFDSFHPHITLGYGRPAVDMKFPIPFRVARLAICHLGNHCTCRRVLASANL